MTEVSVLLPVRNAAATVADQLEALAAQEFDGAWELIVVDNGSTDGTRAIVEGFADRLPLRIVDASEQRGAAYARNRGIDASSGRLLLFCDGDDVVAPGWLAALAAAVREHELVAGGMDHRFFRPATSDVVVQASRTGPLYGGDWMHYAIGANMAIQRTVFERSGGFDESLPSGEDKELSWRLQVAGCKLSFEPEAVVSKRPRLTFGPRFLQHYRWGFGSVVIYKKLRAVGMPRSNIRYPILEAWWIVTRLPLLAVSRQLRLPWATRAGARAGQLVGSIVHRVLYL